MPIGGATDRGPEQEIYTICGQKNVRTTARDNTGQNTYKEYTPSSRIKIKISDHAGKQTRAPGL